MVDIGKLEALAKLVRYYILRMTTKAGSGHATSALSATDIMVALFFNKLRFGDRVIFSKGHASPLLYALYAAAGVLSEKDLDTYRKFGSPLEGHPTPRFKYVEVATGSLGQGLSIGLGMALTMRTSVLGSRLSVSSQSVDQLTGLATDKPKTDKLQSENRQQRTDNWLPRVYVLMGDSETSEGSVWEAAQLASYYKEVSLRSTSLRSSSASWRTAGLEVGNLIGIIDVNRLGQSGETMLGWDVDGYKKRVEAFGWDGHIIDGHDFGEILDAFDRVGRGSNRPQMIIAKTVKGKGISFLENQEGWHGKALSEEQYQLALKELGEVDKSVRGEIRKPIRGPVASFLPASARSDLKSNSEGQDQADLRAVGSPSTGATPHRIAVNYKLGEMVATRKAYGETLAKLGEADSRIVALDAEVKNSTFAQDFAEKFPERFYECFIAEQNMVGMALGMAKVGKIPFVSTFAAFLTRSFDQIRMAAVSNPNIKFVGSHAGVSIGEDGPSQMGLEDLAMFRAVFGSVVLCPADAVSCAKLVAAVGNTDGIVYIRTARPPTPVIYKGSEEFRIGGSKVVRSSKSDKLTIVAAGVTLIEAIAAADELARVGVNVRVIDAYSIKPIDEVTLKRCASETNGKIITVEDHYFEGGLGDAVLNVFANDSKMKVVKLAVTKMPMSGKSNELLDYEEISRAAIVDKVKRLVG